MEQNIITFTGKNEKLFSRSVIEVLTPKLALLVPETHTAILIKDGQMLQTLSSGKYLISKFVDLKTETESALEVLFMSKTAKLKLLWGTASKFLFYDVNLKDNYKVGMSGDFDVQIGDPRKCYLYLVGADKDLTASGLQERLMSSVTSVAEIVTAEYINQNSVSFNQITVHKKQISMKILEKLNQKLMSEYGIAVFSFNIVNVIIDEEDLKRLSAEYKQNSTVSTENCEGCGELLNPDVKFCPNCGKKVGATKVCLNCSTENSDTAKFCSNCGTKL